GHGRADLADAARRQAETLAYYPVWNAAHPPAIELAARLAELAPGDLNRTFFTSGGGGGGGAPRGLAPPRFRAGRPGPRRQAIAREVAYPGTTRGALAVPGIPTLRPPFEPLAPGASHVVNTNAYRHVLGDDEKAFMLTVTDALEERIRFEGPETVAAVYLE